MNVAEPYSVIAYLPRHDPPFVSVPAGSKAEALFLKQDFIVRYHARRADIKKGDPPNMIYNIEHLQRIEDLDNGK